ncbi:F0F1 ATP synthase subunit delta [SAR86 cluster bacterium]|jgi:F-type H+-transporting ATPase subunit delta|nr:F0F1 ATP synthase subunit delta [SAR86 cluster bacterium]|tara:strand:+ start:784 stop:1320 length:537 start_codon:yes stop_codon:yes gene_type:complete
MSELLTQSRPYAEAIFDIAKEEQTLDAWVSDLSVVVSAMQEDEVKILINTPDLSQRNKAEIFTSLFEGEISKKVSNFVLVIGQANRINLLESVLESFKRLVALEKNQKNVMVASSYSLEQDQLDKIQTALQKRTGSEINISTHLDKSLIGGIKISYEDQVIDLSLKNKLEALKAQLRN